MGARGPGFIASRMQLSSLTASTTLDTPTLLHSLCVNQASPQQLPDLPQKMPFNVMDLIHSVFRWLGRVDVVLPAVSPHLVFSLSAYFPGE